MFDPKTKETEEVGFPALGFYALTCLSACTLSTLVVFLDHDISDAKIAVLFLLGIECIKFIVLGRTFFHRK